MPEPARKSRAERRELARSTMLEAAIQLLAERGYAGMRLGDVSKTAGYAYGLAPFYFESKSGLMTAIQEEIDRAYTEFMAASCDPDADGRTFVEQWVASTFAFSREYPAHWRASVVLLVESVVAVPEVGAQHSGFVSRNVRTLQDALERGVVDGSVGAHVDPHACAVAIEALMKGLNFDRFADRSADLDERSAIALEVVGQLLAAR
jgi:AcrR family transcriptional regulator